MDPRVLGLLARTIESEFTASEIARILKSIEIPDSILALQESHEHRSVEEVFKIFASESKDGWRIIFSIIEEFLHPLNHNADEEKTKVFEVKIRKILQHEGLHLVRQDTDYLVLQEPAYEDFIGDRFNEHWIDVLDSLDEQHAERLRRNTKLKEDVVKVVNLRLTQDISSTIVENGTGFLILNGGKLKIGPAKNNPFKLLEVLCPLGKSVAISAAFRASNTPRSKLKNETLSIEEQMEHLKHRVKELQDPLRINKSHIKVRLRFNQEEQTVFLERIRKE